MAIAHKKMKLVTSEEWDKRYKAKRIDYSQTHIVDHVWEGAVRAVESKEEEHGKANMGPWSDIEWGMINGNLSALRWAFGDEWDMLDT